MTTSCLLISLLTFAERQHPSEIESEGRRTVKRFVELIMPCVQRGQVHGQRSWDKSPSSFWGCSAQMDTWLTQPRIVCGLEIYRHSSVLCAFLFVRRCCQAVFQYRALTTSCEPLQSLLQIFPSAAQGISREMKLLLADALHSDAVRTSKNRIVVAFLGGGCWMSRVLLVMGSCLVDAWLRRSF